jgi:23S rRNA (adenine2503-C2)-methyltransferase
MPRPPLLDLSRDALRAWCVEQGHAAYRADQIRRWVLNKRVDQFEAMSDLPAGLRSRLAEEFDLFTATIAAHQRSRDGTEKLLLEWPDGQRVECVLMREAARQTVCLSTQVGCGMGCVFCASGIAGLVRNLTTGEIVEQAALLDRRLAPGERITNVVVMGMGEPLANLPGLLPALAALEDKDALGLSPRRITISTVGLPDRMRELAATGKPYNLAVSLHAPNDELRNELVPVNESIGLRAVLDAADDYFTQTGRRVTYEYVVLRGKNDSIDAARELAALLRGRNAHVNLIPMNPVGELPWHDPSRDNLREMVETLAKANVAATIRKRKGVDIDAACGQLRLRTEQADAISAR